MGCVNHRRLGLETLEGRAMLAGNVTVSLVRSGSEVDVLIKGDNAANSIDIYSPSLDVYKVVGKAAGGAPTKINGKLGGSYTFRLTSFNDDIRVEMNGGNDIVYMRGLTANPDFGDLDAHDDIRIYMGSGNDSVYLRDVEAQKGDILVDLGTGQDYLSAERATAGDDFIVTNSTTSRTRQVTRVNLDDVYAADDLDIDLYYSLDRVNITDTSAKDVRVDLNSGDDKLNIKRSRARSSSLLNGGTGNDDLNFYANTPYTFARSNFKTPTRLNIMY